MVMSRIEVVSMVMVNSVVWFEWCLEVRCRLFLICFVCWIMVCSVVVNLWLVVLVLMVVVV